MKEKNFLLISGSPRKGNTEFALNEILEMLQGKKELILLRNKKISRCTGCMHCDKTKDCSIKDDMQEIRQKLQNADVLIIGAPSYYQNVPGLLKDFIDRTNPFYDTGLLKGKKVIAIVTCGGRIAKSKKVASVAIKCFANLHKMRLVKSYFFRAFERNELSESKKARKQIERIMAGIQKV